ncbi:TolC family outer membrane protein [Oharaeibacter diazotrophicus]|uniref:Outer membrane protein n=1 Tax=Oharaeibacter diazotrophicus TaxID=1920512 RepID=A0A4R6RK46_9HYPH|nr:TolC family outer membrane protein [Oharaeibacter diazotrophicus]TDP86923.1 outer membrane protein [Oharaeibacter diazotrophicus]BBE71134.1 outer membrane efflux protein BepC precursor [Pleomorphomonas sp. SM30]GLS77888.1 transporter [Oharaeibacter diazotrophicus]
MASKRGLLLSAALSIMLAASPAAAESITEALAAAYANNPQLNAARAGTRATDESVPQALANYRPTISAYSTASESWSKGLVSRPFQSPIVSESDTQALTAGITIVQPLFRGFRTENGVLAAEASVRASRESLRNVEQSVLYSAASAYMDVIRDDAILALRKNNVEFLREQVRAAEDRFQVGEGTRTDVAQAEAALATATSLVSVAQANALASRATYRQVIGHDPKNLKASRGVDVFLPKSLDAATKISRAQHPAILATVHNADAASYNVKIAEGALLPTLQLEAGVSRTWTYDGGRPSDEASLVARLNIPIYEGGVVYSQVREAKETLGQLRIVTDQTRDEVQASLVAAWGALEAARAQTVAAKAGVEAAQLALQGVIEEQKVGQRTTLDVLQSQQDVIDTRITQITAERDSVVAAYAILSGIGKLSRDTLNLKVASYKPEQHYQQVRDKWIGLRTPDGR